MTQNPSEPQNELLVVRIAKKILPVEEDEEFPPPDEGSYWSDCTLAFQRGLAFGILQRDLARRLLDEIVSEMAEREWPWSRAVQRREGSQPPSLSDVDAINWAEEDQRVKELAEFVRGELGL